MKLFIKIVKFVVLIFFIMISLYFFRYNEYNKYSFCCDGIKFLTYVFDNLITLLKSYSFVFLIIFLFIKNPIINLINRIKEVKSKELSFKFDDNIQVLPENKDWFNDYLKNEDLSKIVKEQYDTLKRNFKLKKLDAVSDNLLKKLTDFSLALNFEKLYNVIFRSQARAIMYLYNNKNKSYIDESLFKVFYDNACSELPGFYNSYSYEKWLGFLINNKFVERKNSKISLDYIGKAFCYYIIHQGYNIEYISSI